PARHPLPLDALLRTLDGMAALGLNVLHLHLNDDQGFRVETPSCPQLHGRAGADGHLSIADVRALVEAAAVRGIRVVPELDVPGHAGALLWARPDLAAGPPPTALPRAFGPGRHALDPTLDATWTFLDGVVGDLVAQFPDAFLHLGGDEVHPDVFAFEDARRRAWMAERSLEDSAAVQAWFIREMVALLARHGRRAVGWDEVLHPAVPESLVVQSWRGAASLRTATAAGHDALFSSGWYLDLMYPAGLHYAFDPAADGQAMARAEARILDAPALAGLRRGAESLLKGAEAARSRTAARPGRILGGEACLWGELVTAELLDMRLYGRLPAVAERLWSEAAVDDEADHYRRLPSFLAHLQTVTACRPLDGHRPVLARLGIGGVEGDERGDKRGDDGGAAADPLLAHVETLMAALEPARWYRRLLGPEALANRLGEGSGMGSAAPRRPYDADRPLRRIVDLLPPESLDVRAFDAELAAASTAPAAVAALQTRARRWRDARDGLAGVRARIPELDELGPQLEALAACGELLDAWLARQADGAAAGKDLAARLAAIEASLPAHGEVTLAVLAPLRARIAA
ncbi:MAG TPA: family 20 glycosylhydrolase, partial [Pseudomonadales bacterium]|nr:family 20 glycosylhydrolase [Pseudomonadales bacterium]